MVNLDYYGKILIKKTTTNFRARDVVHLVKQLPSMHKSSKFGFDPQDCICQTQAYNTITCEIGVGGLEFQGHPLLYMESSRLTWVA